VNSKTEQVAKEIPRCKNQEYCKVVALQAGDSERGYLSSEVYAAGRPMFWKDD
jgi:hypothetical protein